jgi:parallel beta-helix repeat protein
LIVGYLALATLLGSASAMAATRYVDKADSECSDSGQGTQQIPYCTINKAATVAVAGDTVIVASGSYSEQVTVNNSGTSTAPVIFTVAEGANVTVKGQAYGFYLSSRGWITINGFTISSTDHDGIYLKSCSNITVSNNHVSRAGLPASGYTAHGIFLNSTVDSLLLNNTLDFNTDAGIYLANGSTRITIKGNVSSQNARGYIRAAPGIDIRSGSNIIDSNICHDNEDSGIQLYTTDPSDNLIVNNLTYNNGDHGIDVSRPKGSTIVGNTVYNNVTVGINLEGGATGGLLANNISVDNGIDSTRTVGNIRVDSDSLSGTTLDYDLVYLTQSSTMIVWGTVKYSSLLAFVAATGKEVHGMEEDPLWVSSSSGDFHLLEGSPAIDSANSGVTGAASVDLEGNPRVDDPATADTGTGSRTYDDRGAYELQTSSDTTSPTVAVTAPLDNAGVSGIQQVSANAQDNVGVVGVQFELDGNDLGTEVTSAPYTIFWNTTTVSDGPHSLTAVARDAVGNSNTSATVGVIVDNTPPTVALTAPSDNATVTGTIPVSADASDNAGVIGVQFKVDGINLGTEVAMAPYSMSWDTSTVANGVHSLTALARDAAGNTTTSVAIGVVAANIDTTPPTVAISAPVEGATVHGTILVSAEASDNVIVQGVQFLVDGNNLGSEVTSVPYTISWDTTTVADGAHSLTAVARDAAGNSTTSVTIGVNVVTTSVLTFTSTADAYINAGSPNKNYGSSERLWVQSPAYEFLIKFSVSGIGSRQVTSARLLLYNVNSSDRGGDFYRVADNSWTETGVTWNNAPAKDASALASLGSVVSNTWLEVDITPLVTGDGVFSLRIASPSTDSAGYDSKEASGYSPQLVVTLQ